MLSLLLAITAPPLGVEATLDQRQQISVNADTGLSAQSQFQAGSISKYACSLMALKLAEQGRFSIDDRLDTLLPGYTGPSASDISLADLLANRSGLPDDLLPAFQADPSIASASLKATDAANRFAAGSRSEGQGWAYDLGNWILVQAIIEQSTGLPLADAAEMLLLTPAGLENSRFDSGVPALQESPEPAASVRPFPPFLTCAGGLVTTPSDLLRLVDWAYRGGLSHSSLERLHRFTTRKQNYTLGGRIRLEEDKVLSWQTGSNGPYKSQLVYDPHTGEGWAAMTASDDSEPLSAARTAWLNPR